MTKPNTIIYMLFQRRNTTNDDYMKDFDDYIKVIDSYRGNTLIHLSLVKSKLA